MSTAYPDLFAALTAPFEAWEVKTRSAPGGKQLSYVSARTVANRLDQVVGPERWFDDYFPGQNSVICRLTIILDDGRAVTKCDAGGYAGMADEGDDDKSGFSDALKRAAAKWGIGRYLWRDGVPIFDAPVAEPIPEPVRPQPVAANHRPAAVEQAPPEPTALEPPTRPSGPRDGQLSRPEAPSPDWKPVHFDGDGRAFFKRIKDLEEQFGDEVVSLRRLMDWMKSRGSDARMIDWTVDQRDAAWGLILSRLPGDAPGPPAPSMPPPASGVKAWEPRRPETPEQSLTISRTDPDAETKQSILSFCKQIALREQGLPASAKPSAESVVKVIGDLLDGHPSAALWSTLRHTKDRALLDHVMRKADHHLETLDLFKGTV